MSGILSILLAAGGDKVSLAGFNAATSVVVGITATASYSLSNAGDINATATNNTIADRGDWIFPQVNMALYEVRATLQTGGPLTSGTMGTYLSLGTTRTWTLAQAPIGSIGATVLFEFRRIGDTAIVHSQVVTFSAQST